MLFNFTPQFINKLFILFFVYIVNINIVANVVAQLWRDI